MRKCLALFIMFLTCFAACSEGEDGAMQIDSSSFSGDIDDPNTTAGDPEPRSEAELSADFAAAESALLTLADFPPGWSSEPADASSDEDDSKVGAAFADCMGVDAALIADDLDSAESDTFTQELSEVEAAVTMQPTLDNAVEEAKAVLGAKAPQCFGQVFTAELEADAAEDDGSEAIEIVDVTTERIDFAPLGDESMAMRIAVTLSSQGRSVVGFLDIVLIRSGRATATLSFLNFAEPFDAGLADQLARTFADRLPTGL